MAAGDDRGERPALCGRLRGRAGAARLADWRELFDRQVRQVGQDVGQLGETRLFLMGALLMADELADARGRMAASRPTLAQAQTDQARARGQGGRGPGEGGRSGSRSWPAGGTRPIAA